MAIIIDGNDIFQLGKGNHFTFILRKHIFYLSFWPYERFLFKEILYFFEKSGFVVRFTGPKNLIIFQFFHDFLIFF